MKLRILRSLTKLFIILVSLTRSLFSEKMLISIWCISGLMSNLIKISWKDSSVRSPWFISLLPLRAVIFSGPYCCLSTVLHTKHSRLRGNVLQVFLLLVSWFLDLVRLLTQRFVGGHCQGNHRDLLFLSRLFYVRVHMYMRDGEKNINRGKIKLRNTDAQ